MVDGPAGRVRPGGRRVSDLAAARPAPSTTHYQPGLDGVDGLTHTNILLYLLGFINLLVPHGWAVGSVHNIEYDQNLRGERRLS